MKNTGKNIDAKLFDILCSACDSDALEIDSHCLRRVDNFNHTTQYHFCCNECGFMFWMDRKDVEKNRKEQK